MAAVITEALNNMEQWDDFVKDRYDPNRKTEDFREYDDSAPTGVREFYRLNHTHQTRDFARTKQGTIWRQKQEPDGHLGGPRLSQHAGG